MGILSKYASEQKIVSILNVTNIVIHQNVSSIKDNLVMDILFECEHDLSDEVEWSVTYVGSSITDRYDQVLTEVVNEHPITKGKHQIRLDCSAPDLTKVPENDRLGTSVLSVRGKYRGQEFIHAGYYIKNEYPASEVKLIQEWNQAEEKFLAQLEKKFEREEEEETKEEVLVVMPLVQIDKLQRVFLNDKPPRVTRHPIEWFTAEEQQTISLLQNEEAEEVDLKTETIKIDQNKHLTVLEQIQNYTTEDEEEDEDYMENEDSSSLSSGSEQEEEQEEDDNDSLMEELEENNTSIEIPSF